MRKEIIVVLCLGSKLEGKEFTNSRTRFEGCVVITIFALRQSRIVYFTNITRAKIT
jgi:hypothetical protein